MEPRRRSDRRPSSPPPTTTPSPCLRDVSNYKTPRSRFQNPNPTPLPIFFTASKKTPSSSFSNPALRLKALELDQSLSSRKIQSRRERDLKSFAQSVSAWLNFLFQNPRSCGCNVGAGDTGQGEGMPRSSKGERDSLDGGARSPKRQRRCPLMSSCSSKLKVSLQDVCSFEDVKERMQSCMSTKSCNEVMSMMNQICKNIDEGRLIMKAHCPIVTDLRLKEKAVKVLMCYHPTWLRIGLNIALGGDSLLLNEGQSDQEDLFLKMIVEKQFFSHIDLARSYAYNKSVEGLYRPGYYEGLGKIILKRFLLLVISLDKAKCESALSIKYGIDGLDGGSPLLFCRHSAIKSSQQVIHEFLSEVMHGEGDLLAHLVIVGCKVNYQQSPLAEYEFSVTNLFKDLQDGILLCRAIHLLQSDPSILTNMMSSSHTRKKNLQNCSVAFQFLKKIGVPLYDGDGVRIVAEDIANGDKELTLSILWNMFLHMQVPLIIDKTSLVEEIIRIKGSDMDLSMYRTMTHMALLLEWIQVVCKRYLIQVDSFASLIDGNVLRYLMYYYIGIEETHSEYTDYLARRYEGATVGVQGFVLVQRVMGILGNFPQLLSQSGKLDQDASYDERSLIILLVFLASRLIHKENLDQITELRRSICLSPVVKSSVVWSTVVKSSSICQALFSSSDILIHQSQAKKHVSPSKKEWLYNYSIKERAATVIQSWFRGFNAQKKFLKIKLATSFLQTVTRAWLAAAYVCKSSNANVASSVGQSSSDIYNRYIKYMIERQKFLEIKKSVLLIQRLVRTWNNQRDHKDYDVAATFLQSYICGHIGRSTYILLTQPQKPQTIFGDQVLLEYQSRAAVKIQSRWRGWYTRKSFFCDTGAILEIQDSIRCLIRQRTFTRCTVAAVEIQRWWRQALMQKSRRMSVTLIQCFIRGFISRKAANLKKNRILVIQRWWRKYLFFKLRERSVLIIQAHFHGWIARRAARQDRHLIVIIQRWWRKFLFNKLRERSVLTIQSHFRGWIARRAAKREKHHIVVIQSYWKGWLVRKASERHELALLHQLEKSAGNVDDVMQMLNMLVGGCRSISNIRHACATLGMATEHSQECCDKLVAAGVVEILLKQFHSLNRGVPDQEILKHVLCILRNIVLHPHLVRVLLSTSQSVEIVFQEVLRNKGEGYFFACEILKAMCLTEEGLGAIRRLQGHVRRLTILTHDLERKAEQQKRNARLNAGKDATMRRLKEAVNLLHLIADDQRQ